MRFHAWRLSFGLRWLLLLLATNGWWLPPAASWSVDEEKLRTCASDLAQQVESIYTSGNVSTNATARQYLVASATSDFTTGCLGVSVQTARAVRIMAPKTGLLPLLQQHAADFEAKTGIRVVLNPVTFYEIGKEIKQELTAGISDFSDGWVLDPSVTGEVAGLNGFKSMDEYIPEDAGLEWNDISRFFRTTSAIYDGKVVAIPLDGDLMLMYYRRDLFKRYNLSVPATWDDFVQLAEQMNGTTVTDEHGGAHELYGACFDISPAVCKANFILIALVAPYIQYRGTAHGVFYDPETMAPLVDNAAMARALELYRRLFAVQPQAPTCAASNQAFRNHTCLMTINWGDEFRANAVNTSADGLRDHLGVAQLPGAAEVLDRTTGQLVPCSSHDMCPYAVPTRLANGSTALVNFAPYSAFGGWAGAVSNIAPPEYQRKAYKFFSYVASPTNSWRDVSDPTAGIDPYRRSQLAPDPENLARWAAAGFTNESTLDYLSAVNIALESGNVVLDSRLQRAGMSTRLIFEDGLRNLTWNRAANPNLTVGQLLRVMHAQVAAGLTASGPLPELQRQYCKLIGCAHGGGPAEDEGDSRTRFLAVYIAVPVGVVLLVLAVVLLMWWRHAHLRNLLTGGIKAPGAGPATTLLITDIESSTALWELLPERVMGEAVEVHHRIVRRALAQYAGYESATEGDSFICAFHTASEAVQCALNIQQELLTGPWPPELLACQACSAAAEVSLKPRAVHDEVMEMLLPRIQSGEQQSNRWPRSDPRDGARGGAATGGVLGRLCGGRLGAGKSVSGVVAPGVGGDLFTARLSDAAETILTEAGGGPGTSAAGLDLEVSPLDLDGASARLYDGFSDLGAVTTRASANNFNGRGGGGGGFRGGTAAAAGAGAGGHVPSDGDIPRISAVAAAVAAAGLKMLPRHSGGGGGGGLPSRPQAQHNVQLPAQLRSGVSRLSSGLLSTIASGNCSGDDRHPHVGVRTIVAARVLYDCIAAAWRLAAEPLPLLEMHIAGGGGAAAGSGAMFSRTSEAETPIAVVAAAAPPGSGAGVGGGALPAPSSSPSASSTQGMPYMAQSRRPTGLGAWRKPRHANARTATSQCVFRGLRVRIGMASGVPEVSDVSYNSVEARFHYSGAGMRLARAIQGAAAGGMVLLSDSTFAQQRQEQAGSGGGGGQQKHAACAASRRGGLAGVLWLHMGQHDLHPDLPPQQVYQAVAQPLAGRLSLFPPLISRRCLSAGVLHAPVRRAAVAFVYVVGASSLLAWDTALARQALALLETVFAEELAKSCGRGVNVPAAAGSAGSDGGAGGGGPGGSDGGFAYIVEAAGGLLLTSFSSPAQAVRCCLAIVDAMPDLPWPAALLENALCEELAVARVDRRGRVSREVLFRGLRLKAGLDYGTVHATINAATGRVSYRGRVMNRAARIASSASSGQVLCSRDLYDAAVAAACSSSPHGLPPIEAAAGAAEHPAAPFFAISLGTTPLKGLPEPVELMLCRAADPLSPRSSVDQLPLQDVPEHALQMVPEQQRRSHPQQQQVPGSPRSRRLSVVLRTEHQQAAARAMGLPTDAPLQIRTPRGSMVGMVVGGGYPSGGIAEVQEGVEVEVGGSKEDG